MDKKVELWTDEELVYGFGQYLIQKENDEYKIAEIQAELKLRGLLVEDDGMGGSWMVWGGDDLEVVPELYSQYSWDTKGNAWVFWAGLQRPHGSRLFCISDPQKEEDALHVNGPINLGDSHLSVVPN